MVRVIPVHSFIEKKVSKIEEPTASCVVNSPTKREFLLLALISHCVEVHELSSSELNLFSTFPTVDLVQSILHCSRGNYVATLESKCSRDNIHSSNFVRIYVNWEQHDHKYPMRARIAGRVTPSLNRPINGLEMIELPLNGQPTAIACCQKTGNLLVALGNSAILHEFKIETQQQSKLKFIDFEARPWSLGFHFVPTRIELAEDFVSIMDPSRFVVFRLSNPFYEVISYIDSSSSNSDSVESSSSDRTTISTDALKSSEHDSSSETNANYVLKTKEVDGNDKDLNMYSYMNLRKFNKEKYVDWDALARNERKEVKQLMNLNVIQNDSLTVTVNLPSISLEQVDPTRTVSPFELNSLDTEVFIKTNSPEDGWSENYVVKSILRLKIVMLPEVNNFEYFTCSVMKPLYLKTKTSGGCVKKTILHSDEYKYLSEVTCLICTIQEGYVYHFSSEVNNSEPVCLTTYSFTSPVSHVALENTVLHALTEAGLESYILRFPHYIAKTFDHVYDRSLIYPDTLEPVCLIGLKPFLWIQQLLNSKNYLVLLAKAEDSWTLYSLKLPKVEDIYMAILNAANSHKISCPSTYKHLLQEACSMLWLATNIADSKENDAEKSDEGDGNNDKLQAFYRQVCALLGDFYMSSESKIHWRLCIQFYKMSGLKPWEVLSGKSVSNAPGLLTYITEILSTIHDDWETDALFQEHNIVDIIATENKEDLLKLILKSYVLREYMTNKLIKLLTSEEKDDLTKITLAILYIHADKASRAEKTLELVSQTLLRQIILELPHLLFEDDSVNVGEDISLRFSEFAGILMRQQTDLFIDVLVTLIEKGYASLWQVIKAFEDFFSCWVRKDNHCFTLQMFLEIYLQRLFWDKDLAFVKNEVNRNKAIKKGIKILFRSYMGILMQMGVRNVKVKKVMDDTFLLGKYRPWYLDKMPPCSMIACKDSKQEDKVNNDPMMCSEAIKMQALLASGVLPVECLAEIRKILTEVDDVIGSLSLKTLIIDNRQTVTSLLIKKCPGALLQYAKDKYTEPSEWEFLIKELINEILRQGNKSKEYFEHILRETVEYVAVTSPLKSLNLENILPKDSKEFASQIYMDVYDHAFRARRVKLLIKEMGQRLLHEVARPQPQGVQNLAVCSDLHGEINFYSR